MVNINAYIQAYRNLRAWTERVNKGREVAGRGWEGGRGLSREEGNKNFAYFKFQMGLNSICTAWYYQIERGGGGAHRIDKWKFMYEKYMYVELGFSFICNRHDSAHPPQLYRCMMVGFNSFLKVYQFWAQFHLQKVFRKNYLIIIKTNSLDSIKSFI